MSTIFNAAPMPYLRGIRDASRGVNVRDPEQLPTHLPHFYIYAEKGPTEPTYCADGSASTIFGQKTFDPRYGYFNHQTICAQEVSGEGNGIFLQRVIPSDAGPKARILLSADIVDDLIPQYQRDVNGKFLLDSGGNKIQISGGGATAPGNRIKWIVNSWAPGGNIEDFGEVSSRVGSMTNSDSDQSTIYPILELEVNFVGAYGNNIAIRITAPNSESDIPLSTDAVAAIKSYIYRLVVLTRESPELSPNVMATIGEENAGDQFVSFCFNPDGIDTRRDIDYTWNDRIIDAYEDMTAPGQETPIYGPFGRQHLYRANLDVVLAAIGALEAPKGTLPDNVISPTSEYLYSVNPFTGTNYDGIPYYTLLVEGPSSGGQRFSDSSQVYAAGGSDGTMNDGAFDLLVRNELLNYGYGEWPMLNWAKYPVSAYYDTGFELDTKLAMCIPLSRRKDLAIIISTHIAGEPQLTPSEESSMAMSLNNMLRNYPESTLYGTGVVRGLIVGHSGKLIGSKYRDFLPLTIELARKFAAYMGAGNGFWRSTAAFDVTPNNQMNRFSHVNVRWKPETQRYRDWDNGLIWIEDYDRRAKFFPAIQTVYSDDTSVLNAAANMWIAVDLQKVALRSWRDLTGNSKWSDEQFLERSNELIAEDTRGKYDERAVIVPHTFYSSADKRRNYSWSCEIDMYTNSLKSAGSFTIVAKQLRDLNTES